MKILQIHNHHYLFGGAERVYLETTKLLIKRGHDVVNFSLLESKTINYNLNDYFVPFNISEQTGICNKIIYYAQRLYSIRAAKNIKMLIEAKHPDVAHIHSLYNGLTPSILPILKRNKIPIIMTLHDLKLLCPSYYMLNNSSEICEKCAKGNITYSVFNRCIRNSYLLSCANFVETCIRNIFFNYYKYVDKFIIPSNFAFQKYIEYKKVNKEKFVQISNFVDFDNYNWSYIRGKYFLYFGRLSREKGILTLLDAWRYLRNEKIVIIGDGPLKNEVEEFIKKYNMKNVFFMGYVEGEKLKNFIKNSYFVIVPSICYENNPMSIIESQSLGKPVIGANIGGIPELIKVNETGFLFEPQNTKELLDIIKNVSNTDESEYKRLATNARTFAENKYDSNIYYNKLINLYRSVL